MPFREFAIQAQAACRLVLHDQIRDIPPVLSHPAVWADLPAEDLAQRMRALPDQYLHILLLRYGCGVPYGEIDALLGIEQTAGTARFALHLLSYGLSLSAPPSERVLQAAAQQILGDYSVESGAGSTPPSKGFKRRMRTIFRGKAPQPVQSKGLPLRTLAVAAIAAVLLLALAAVTIAAMIRNSFNWSVTADEWGVVVEATDIQRDPTAEDYEEMRLYQPVMPEGFSFAYTDDRDPQYLIDYYHSKSGQRIILWKTLAGPLAAYRVTNEEMDSYEEIERNGTTYLCYHHSGHGRSVIIWEIDGFAFMLVAPMDREQALQVAGSVSQ